LSSETARSSVAIIDKCKIFWAKKSIRLVSTRARAAQNCHRSGFLFALLSRILWIKIAPEKVSHRRRNADANRLVLNHRARTAAIFCRSVSRREAEPGITETHRWLHRGFFRNPGGSRDRRFSGDFSSVRRKTDPAGQV
jgi:hypothetical protein